MIFHKHRGPYEVFYEFIQKGILSVEDSYWKKKKKILSKVFNYDFVVSQIPDMVKISDSTFDKIEE